MIGDNETNFPHKLSLNNRQVSNLRKAFSNHLSTDIKLSKTQLLKMIQSGEFLGRLLGPLLKTGLPLIKNVIKPLAKSVFEIWVIETVQNEVKERKGGFLSMLLGTLGASLLGNLLTGRGVCRAGKGKGIVRAGEGNNMDF